MPPTEPAGQNPPPPKPWEGYQTLRVVAYAVIVLAGSWYMLGQLASVLRPLLLASFLGYVLMPYYSRMRNRLPAPVAITLLASLSTLLLLGVASAVTVSLLDLSTQGPILKAKAIKLSGEITDWINAQGVLTYLGTSAKPPEAQLAEKITDGIMMLVNIAAMGLPEAFAAGLYLLFLLLESQKFPDRVRRAYPEARADNILHIFGRINAAIISYLKAKVKSSLLLAVPVGILLACFNVPFAFLWAVLTFACNFIPYIGSVVSFALPVVFGFLHFDSWITPTIIAGLLLGCQVLSASIVEPMLIGKAIGLSPIIILAALSVWGILWGLPGMFLAVPLTVVVKIVLENIEITRPIARLLSGE